MTFLEKRKKFISRAKDIGLKIFQTNESTKKISILLVGTASSGKLEIYKKLKAESSSAVEKRKSVSKQILNSLIKRDIRAKQSGSVKKLAKRELVGKPSLYSSLSKYRKKIMSSERVKKMRVLSNSYILKFTYFPQEIKSLDLKNKTAFEKCFCVAFVVSINEVVVEDKKSKVLVYDFDKIIERLKVITEEYSVRNILLVLTVSGKNQNLLKLLKNQTKKSSVVQNVVYTLLTAVKDNIQSFSHLQEIIVLK